MTITELEKLSASNAVGVDGVQLRILAVPATEWATLQPSTAVVMRVRGEAGMVCGFIVDNKLSRFIAPALQIRQLLGTDTTTVKRRSIQELGRYELGRSPAQPNA